MKKWIAGLLVVLSVGAINVKAEAVVVNFDDLIGQTLVPNGYGGIATWTDWEYYSWSQPPYTPSSDPTRVYALTLDNSMEWSSPVDFQGAWFSGPDFTSVYFEGYLANVLQGTSGSLAPSSTATFLAANFNNVDRVRVVSAKDRDLYVMDDVTYNEGQGNGEPVIPEPATMALLGSGLLGFAGLRRKRS